MEPTDFVTREVVDLKFSLVNQGQQALMAKMEELLAEQRKTNGKVQSHSTQIARIWAIGTTAWGIAAVVLAWVLG